jgi:hypothetical protein
MSFPKTGTYGVIDNPIVFSVYSVSDAPGEGNFAMNDFLLMDGEMSLLMAGGNFLLMGT